MIIPRFKDLSESARTVIITLACESVPLISLAFATSALMNDRMVENAEKALEVEVDGMLEHIDLMNTVNLQVLHAFRDLPLVRDYCLGSPATRASLKRELATAMQLVTRAGSQLALLSVLGPEGKVWASTEPAKEGLDISGRGFVRRALAGEEAVSDVFRARPEFGGGLTVSYPSPVKDPSGAVTCVVMVTAHAEALDAILETGHAFEGADSSIDLLDAYGIRLSHSGETGLAGRPAGILPADEVAAMVGEGRFGEVTPALLSSPIPDDVLFKLAREPEIPSNAGAFWGVSPESGKRMLAFARRVKTAPWTLVARIPEGEVLGPARQLIRREIGLGVAAILMAMGIGVALVRLQQHRFHAMVAAADALAHGKLGVRIPDPGKDEIGHVASQFNIMAAMLEQAQENLEARVVERTQELAAANTALKAHQDELREQRDELIAQHEEMQRQARELETRNEEAESAGRQKSELLANLSSKLRSPLTAIIDYSNLLLGSDNGSTLTGQRREFAESITTAARQQLALLTDIVDWSELEAGHLQLTSETLPVAALLATARDAIAPQAGRKQITIEVADTTSHPVVADHRRVHQVVLHLLSNAVKFAPRGSTVRLSAFELGASVALEVADRGPGVPEAMWPRLFKPFQQTDSQMMKTAEGTGLGLAVCKRLVEAQGGTITARPREDGGLIVQFTLPQADERRPRSIERRIAP